MVNLEKKLQGQIDATDGLIDGLGRNYTRNEWRRFETTLETSGKDLKLHSKRVEKI
jgi:hypothetical protein